MAKIHPLAVVDPGARLGDDVEVGPYCTIGPNVVLGARTRLISHVVLDGHTVLGEDNLLHPFTYLGSPPQHLAHRGEPTRVEIGSNNVFREHATVHAGTVLGGGVTKIGSNSLFMVGAHIAHDCIIGDSLTFVNHATLAGHVRIGDFVYVGGLSGVHQFSRIGRYAFVGAGAIVTRDVIPYGSVWGNHAHLEGLNLVGLKRRGFSREAINDLRSAYRLLFADEGTLQERLEDVARVFDGSPHVSEIIDFIRADADRPLCQPHVDD
jgi:UDP-N-acetylglucosamine acyltransferase